MFYKKKLQVLKTFFYMSIEESVGVQRREKQIKENEDNFQERKKNFKENEFLMERDQRVKCQRFLLAQETLESEKTTLTALQQELKCQKVEYHKRDQILRNNEDNFQEKKKNFKDSEYIAEKFQRENCQKLQERERELKVKQDNFEQICSNVETEMLSKEHNLLLAQETLEKEKTALNAQQKVLKYKNIEFQKKYQDLRNDEDIFQERKNDFKDNEDKVEKCQRECQHFQQENQESFENICSDKKTTMIAKEHNLL